MKQYMAVCSSLSSCDNSQVMNTLNFLTDGEFAGLPVNSMFQMQFWGMRPLTHSYAQYSQLYAPSHSCKVTHGGFRRHGV